MTENNKKMCRICLTIDRDANVSDSSRYATFFTQIMCIYDFHGSLWLCMWCKASLRRAMSLMTLAQKSDQMLQDKIGTDINTQGLYQLKYKHNTQIDIPPLLLEYQENYTEKVPEKSEEIIDPTEKEVDITLKINKINMQQTDNYIIIMKESNEDSNCENETFGNIKAVRRKNKKEIDFNELNFDVEYLNLEDQLKEVEMKRLKYKDYKFQCNECGMGFLTSDVFDDHKIRHSELSGPHKCQICCLQFKSQDVLSQHMLAHKRRFKCVICSVVFKRWSHCKGHRYKCDGVVQPTACGECSKIFSNEHALNIHMKVHKTEKKYCCDLCDKKFGSKHRLTVHLRCHSGVKPFSCSRCSRSFATSSNLRAHSAIHDHSSQYYCVECHTYYKTAKSLKRHFNESVRHLTTNTVMYTCKECNKQFSTEKSLYYHVNTRHCTEYRCTDCDKTFSNKSNLNKHLKCIHTAK